jgi:hypothetical protein
LIKLKRCRSQKSLITLQTCCVVESKDAQPQTLTWSCHAWRPPKASTS